MPVTTWPTTPSSESRAAGRRRAEVGERAAAGGDTGDKQPEAESEQKLLKRQPPWRCGRGLREHRRKRPPNSKDQERQPAEHRQMQMHQQPAAMADPKHRRVAVIEDDRAKRERSQCVEEAKRDPSSASNKHPPTRGTPDKTAQLEKHKHKTGYKQRRTRPKQRRTREGNPRRNKPSPHPQERQRQPETTLTNQPVTQHHRQQMKRPARHR
jgi:hypothetical protein